MHFVWALMSMAVFVLGVQARLTVNDALLSVRIASPKPASCTQEYEDLGDSTMCEYNDDPSATDLGVSDTDKVAIVNKHNELRKTVNPTATNMQKMAWDDEIAKIAQKFAQYCPGLQHDTYPRRRVPGYGIKIGQNLFLTNNATHTWNTAAEDWFSEKTDFKYGVNPETYQNAQSEPAIGHYTAVVWGIASRIGCGYAKCPTKSYQRQFVCNYAYTNFGSNYGAGTPYNSGTTCAKCQNKCNDKLCDCAGKFCRNGGLLDPNTCNCACVGVFEGDACQTKNCPAADHKSPCDQYDKNDCEKYSNYPIDCPVLCKTCDEPCPGKYLEHCKNNGKLNNQCTCDCTGDWTGAQCEKYTQAKCNTVSDTSNLCPAVANAPTTYCPYYGNVCPKTCYC